MCRWLAYQGPAVTLETLTHLPENSLVEQSLCSHQSHIPINGDGFGIGWYDQQPKPAIYRDLLPAWNDLNFKEISQHVTSPLFMAHVRASTGGTPSSRTNCHPFRHENWLFMHNGDIGDFAILRKPLEQKIAPEYYACRTGNTDSEVIFYLLLSYGLKDNPPQAIQETLQLILKERQTKNIRSPLLFTVCISDGQNIYALRFAADAQAPTLYSLQGSHVHVDTTRQCKISGQHGCVALASEPLDKQEKVWQVVPIEHIAHIKQGQLQLTPLHLSP